MLALRPRHIRKLLSPFQRFALNFHIKDNSINLISHVRTSQAYMQVVQKILKNRQDLYMAQASLGFLWFQ